MPEEASRSPLEDLAELLENGEAEERHGALDSLDKLEGVEPLMLMIKAFGNSMWVIRRRASEIMAGKGEKAIPLLEPHLNDANDDISYWSIRALAGFGESAIKPLQTLLKDKECDKRLFAVTALGETGHTAAVDPLIEALGDPVWSVRKAACEALMGIGKETVPKLRAAIQNPNLNTKYWSVKALGRIMGKEAVPALSKTLSSSKQEMRYYGVVALGETRSEQAIPYLIAALEDQSWIVRQHAAKVLQEIGEPCVPYLVKGFETGGPDLKYWVIRLVGKIMRKRAVTVLTRFLETDDDDLRYYAVTALGETGALEAIPLL
ncbi:MAG: HEAT repeat domain-containing protein, partial [bacterium]|nr:HEAT repeat domain-containing protein [bacterium]